jgi:hypothetical protein
MSGGARVGKSYPSPYAGGRAASISRTGGSFTGPLAGWNPRRVGYTEEGRQREVISDRSNDLVANDPHACSLVESISVNAVGPGMWPQSKPNHKRLGISEEQAAEVAEAAEWEFEQFNREACARGVSDFYGIQYQNLWSTLVNGEFVNLPLMLKDPARRYRLALQVIDPQRMRTPSDLSAHADIRDGIRLGPLGEAKGHFIANPTDGQLVGRMFSTAFTELPPKRGHRPVVMHRFHAKSPEQVRGVGVLGPAMNFFRNFSDYLDGPARCLHRQQRRRQPKPLLRGPAGADPLRQRRREAAHSQERPPRQFVPGLCRDGPARRRRRHRHALRDHRQGFQQDQLLQRPRRPTGGMAGLRALPGLAGRRLLSAGLGNVPRRGHPHRPRQAPRRRA